MTPLERAARAMCRDDDPDEVVYFTDDTWKPFWKGRVADARAVLHAIREPSDEMYWAGDDACLAHETASGVVVWKAMIDAALEEG